MPQDVTPASLDLKAKELDLRITKLRARLPVVMRVAAEMGFPVSQLTGKPYTRAELLARNGAKQII